MFTSIVVALDLERSGDRALAIAASLSPLADMPIELLTVASPHIPEAADDFELRRRSAANGWPVDAHTILHDNDPARAIADHVNARPDALLILSTSAKSPLKRQFLGSVSEAVLSRIRGPVLLVGPHVPSDADMSRPTLVACVDSCDAALSALPVITAWTGTFKTAPPWVVEVLPAPLAAFGVGRDRVESANVQFLVQQLRAVDVPASWEVLHGPDVGDRLEEFVAGVNDHVLVATSTNWTDDRTHWYSTTRRMVQRATRPVLVIPAQRTDTPTRVVIGSSSIGFQHRSK